MEKEFVVSIFDTLSQSQAVVVVVVDIEHFSIL
jgi:hypothetical protein